MEIPRHAVPLVRAFLMVEAGDYRVPTDKITAWVDARMEKISQLLGKYTGKANYLHVTSYSNMGLINRRITITPHPWDACGDVLVDLCTCGSLDCWGTITFPTGKVKGKKGVQPL